ncbi:uncharacterized protein LOC101888779 isoform X2 [Musca domestica]|uniref:Uncharacterized protein LOC101888779 isoform X2 n=1 Tax=Musca domestica TaxID=7370 RepID=A0A9J7DHC3_MUSDO|nr:uncharacterized protein LOC101888779 isoform X2 [Musca domestica]
MNMAYIHPDLLSAKMKIKLQTNTSTNTTKIQDYFQNMKSVLKQYSNIEHRHPRLSPQKISNNAHGPAAVRVKRQIDLTLSAEHDEKEDETELALEAIANLYRSSDGRTQIDGSAKVIHRSNSLQNGPGTDWRVGVRLTFT